MCGYLTLTVLNPSDFAIATIARPTPELAPFWITQDPRGSFTYCADIKVPREKKLRVKEMFEQMKDHA